MNSQVDVVHDRGLVVLREFIDGRIHATHEMTPQKARTLSTWLNLSANQADKQMPKAPA